LALGSDSVLAIVPDQFGAGRETIEFPDLLPTEWERLRLPPEPEAILEQIKDALDSRGPAPVFLCVPWNFGSVGGGDGPLDSLHELAMSAAANHASRGSSVASLLPAPAIANDSGREFRRVVFPAARPDLVIAHQGLGADLGLHPAILTVTVRVVVGAEPGLTRFFEVPEGVEEEGVVEDLRRLLRRDGGPSRFGYVYREPLPPESSLSHDLRSPSLIEGKAALQLLGGLEPVTSLFDLVPTISIRWNPDRIKADRHDGDALLVESQSLAGTTIHPTQPRRWVEPQSDELLRPGDLLISTEVVSGATGLMVIEVPSDAEWPLVGATSVLVLRPHPNVSLEHRRFVQVYLASAFALRVVKALGASSDQVTEEQIGRMLVPFPDSDLGLAIADLEDAASQLRRWQSEISATLSSLFERPAAEARAETLRAGVRIRERVRAGRNVDDIDFRIRTMFPHPIAFRWRLASAGATAEDRYRKYLALTEVTLVYVAAIALTSARALNVPVAHVADLRRRFAERKKGISMGDWMTITDNVRNGRAFRSKVNEAPFPELFELWKSDDAAVALDALFEWRHDVAHLREPAGHQWHEAANEARRAIEALLGSAELLADYPLRLITRTRWREHLERMDYEYRDLRGDHPVVPLAEGSASTSRVETDSLYFVTRGGELHGASPFLLFDDCPTCGQASTFALDRYRLPEGIPDLRALEHGHTVERPDLADELRSVGMVP
jgi:hypothetical protein